MLDDVLNIADLKSGRIGTSGHDRGQGDETRNSIVHLLGNPYGREFLFTFLMEMGCFGQSTFDQSPTASAYLEGRRSAGNRLLQLLKEIAPDQTYMMIREGEKYDR